MRKSPFGYQKNLSSLLFSRLHMKKEKINPFFLHRYWFNLSSYPLIYLFIYLFVLNNYPIIFKEKQRWLFMRTYLCGEYDDLISFILHHLQTKKRKEQSKTTSNWQLKYFQPRLDSYHFMMFVSEHFISCYLVKTRLDTSKKFI